MSIFKLNWAYVVRCGLGVLYHLVKLYRCVLGVYSGFLGVDLIFYVCKLLFLMGIYLNNGKTP